jgi:hypothetical protein
MSATVHFTSALQTKLNIDRRNNDQTTRKKKLRYRFCR